MAVPLLLLLLPLGARAQQMLAPSEAPPPSQPGQQMLAPPAAPPPSQRGQSPHALAARVRWVTVPGWSIGPYLDAHTQLNDGWSVGLEYLYRRSGFDVVVSLDYSWLNGADGNYLAKGHDPTTDDHYLHYSNLSVLSADVSLVGHWNLTPWLELRLGGGLGLGGVFGNIYQITNNPNNPGCRTDPSDPSKCYPYNIGPINPSDPNTVANLEAHKCNPDFSDGGKDTPGSPCYRRTETYPFNARVVPVLNALIGFRFKLHPMAYLHLETGWRLVGFYLGAGPEVRF